MGISNVKLFYFTRSEVDLWNIADTTPEADRGFAPDNLHVHYHANNSWRWTVLREWALDQFEPAQRERIDSYQPASAFMVQHYVFAWPDLLPSLKLVLSRHGGWVGCDDGSFERVYTAENIEQLPHPFGEGFKRASPWPASKPGDRIEIDRAIPQPENVFDFAAYREFIRQVRYLYQEKGRLLQIIASSRQDQPNRPDLSETPESRQYDTVWDQFYQMTHEYPTRLPIHLIAQCPYCGVHILQPVDSFSLMGFDGNLDATRAYSSGVPEWASPLPAQCCKHALCATLSVNLNGRVPERTSGRMLGKSVLMDSAPHVMVWPLIARYTSAVMHALPIGRLDDERPTHRYTAYFATYFVGEGSNLYGQMWVPTEFGGPATAGVQVDIDLLKWVKAGRLYWLDPADTSRLVKGPPEAFPYADVQPKGWYHILQDGQMDGLNPYYQVWQGKPPPHDESFPKSIERLGT